MIQKKVCMLGSFAVGKTSLVRRFVQSIFSDRYQTTIGVRIDKKVVTLGPQTVNLILWDLYGDDEFQRLRVSYLRGSGGYILVADGTRQSTLENILPLQASAEAAVGKVPFVLIVNKADLRDEWEIDQETVESLGKHGWTVMIGSAKTGQGVAEAFLTLAGRMLET